MALSLVSRHMTTNSSLDFRTDVTVKLIDCMGGDVDIVQAAKVSTIGADALEAEANYGLINFLMRNRHGTPFEHAAMKFYMEMPIFVFREFHRHRIGWSYNEMSGRYRQLPPTFYIPDYDRPLVQVGKPGAYTFVPGDDSQHDLVIQTIKENAQAAYGRYEYLLEKDVAKEVARTVLPVGIYSAQFATCNPRSLMAFLSLRTKREGAAFPSFPQREIEMVAEQMEAEFQVLFPLTYRAFEENGRVSP